MLLAITALGYATVWLDGELRHGKTAPLGSAQLLGVPGGKTIIRVLLPIGRCRLSRAGSGKNSPSTGSASFNRYGGKG